MDSSTTTVDTAFTHASSTDTATADTDRASMYAGTDVSDGSENRRAGDEDREEDREVVAVIDAAVATSVEEVVTEEEEGVEEAEGPVSDMKNAWTSVAEYFIGGS